MENNVKRSNGWVFIVVLAVVLAFLLRGKLCSIVDGDFQSYDISSCISSGVSGFGGGSTRGAGYVGRN